MSVRCCAACALCRTYTSHSSLLVYMKSVVHREVVETLRSELKTYRVPGVRRTRPTSPPLDTCLKMYEKNKALEAYEVGIGIGGPSI